MVGETGFEPATPWSRTKAGEAVQGAPLLTRCPGRASNHPSSQGLHGNPWEPLRSVCPDWIGRDCCAWTARRAPSSAASGRELLGLPPGETVRVRPASLEKYAVFVQSTSANRKLMGGTRFLYEVEDWDGAR